MKTRKRWVLRQSLSQKNWCELEKQVWGGQETWKDEGQQKLKDEGLSRQQLFGQDETE